MSEFLKNLIIGVSGGVAALLLGRFLKWLRRPRLKLDFVEAQDGFKVLTLEERKHPSAGTNGLARDAKQRYDAMYFSIRVRNKGSTARHCRGFLVAVEVKDHRGWRSTDYCDSIPLAWSYRPARDARYGIDVPAHVDQFLNVFSVREPSIDEGFQPATVPPTLRKALSRFKEPGEFRFKIVVSADDAEIQQLCVYLKWTKPWSEAWADNCKRLEVREMHGCW